MINIHLKAIDFVNRMANLKEKKKEKKVFVISKTTILLSVNK